MSLALTSVARPRSVAIGCGVAFTCYAAATLPKNPEAITLLGALVGCFALGYALRELKWIWIAYCSLLTLNCALWAFGWPWGIYGNPNYFGCALALGLASALVYSLWWFLPVGLLSLMLTQSRGAILGASAALFIWLWGRSRFWALILLNMGVLTLFLIGSGRDASVWQRLGIWQDTLNHLTVWGSGWGTFADEYWKWPVHRNIGFARAGHAYNDFLELTLELGLGVIALWVFLIMVMTESQHPAKLIIWAYFALALTFFPLYVWPIGPLVAATLGHLVRDQNGSD